MRRDGFFSRSSVFPYDLLVFAVNVVALAAPWVPGLRIVDEESTYRSFVLALLAFNMAALTMLVSLAAQRERNEVSHALSEQRLFLGNQAGERLRDDQFYEQFLLAIVNATSYVYISYFAPTSPLEDLATHRRRYDSRLLALIRKRTNIRFRRLVRDTPSNRQWLSAFLKVVKRRANVDIALLPEPSLAEYMPMALSVQIVDGKECWFVAIESHDRVGEYRDIHMKGEVLSQAMTKYYDRLWAQATPVLTSGRLMSTGDEILRER